MVTLEHRPYRDGDADAVTEILNRVDFHGGGHGGYLSSETRTLIDAFVSDREQDATVRLAPDGTMVAVELTLTPSVGGFRIDLIGGVLPEWRGQGIGRAILAHQLARAEALHAAAGATKDWEAHASAMVGDSDALRLFRRFDLNPLRYWSEMVADTTRPVPASLPDGLRSLPFQPDWGTLVHRAHNEAFLDHWGSQQRPEADWLAVTVQSEAFLPELSRVAFDGDEVAGYVLCYREGDPTRLYIGQVGTRRPWRRRGVAGGLLAEIIGVAPESGFTAAALGVDADNPTGAVGVYERVGFAVESRAVTYGRTFGAG